jgi:hypothetical protein
MRFAVSREKRIDLLRTNVGREREKGREKEQGKNQYFLL